MSYIQIEIGGKKRGLKFNQIAYTIFLKNVTKGEEEATSGPALIWAGLKANCIVKKEEFVHDNGEEITWEEVCDWMSELSYEIQTNIFKCFQETQEYKKLIPQEKEDDDKKKLPLKNTKRSVLK